jgi:hypothetical protein
MGQPTLAVDDSRIRLVAAGGQSQQTRLARTVGANETNPLAVGDGGGDGVENDEVADLSANFVKTQDGHERPNLGRSGGHRVSGGRGVGQGCWLMSLTSLVPVVVPSVFHSSRP